MRAARVVVVGVLGLAGLSGCRQIFGIDDTHVIGDGAPGDDADGDGPVVDAPPAIDGTPDGAWVTDVAHLTTNDEAQLLAQTDFTVNVPVTINTSNLTITPPMGGLPLVLRAQEGTLDQVAVLDARAVTITNQLTVVGSFPLIIVGTTIRVESGGLVDASASGATPGPGGRTSMLGPGSGTQAQPNGSADPGGGGAGFGTIGGDGGDPGPGQIGEGGDPYGDPQLTVLQGGSGGGPITHCEADGLGGAGGGALQLTARTTLTIDGGVDVGGGGGSGGTICKGFTTGGAGGGSGGALYLQALTVTGTGSVAANGGGGGGAAGSVGDGEPGADGARSEVAATGGDGANGVGRGGNGGAMNNGGNDGQAGGTNGGGGGGGVGRITANAMSYTATFVVESPTVIQQ